MKIISILSSLILTVFFSATGFSHNLWLTADNYSPKPGDSVTIDIGWGHGLDKKETMKKNSFRRIYVITPDGKKIRSIKINDTRFRFTAEKAGSYAVGAEINPGFMSKTTTGRVMRNKKGLNNAVSCMNFDIRAKTIINAGGEVPSSKKLVRHPLEIIPLNDPGNLKKDDVLQVMVVFNGKPVAACDIHATHEGFKGKDHEAALSVKTDGNGKATIKIIQRGTWVLQARLEKPYPDSKVCDKYMYAAGFTLSVK